MFRANVVGTKEAEEGGATCGGLDCWTTVGFFAFYNADHGGDDHSGFARSFDCGDGGCSGGADVIDDDDAGAFAAEAFDTAACAVRFFCFADEEAVEERCVRLLLSAPCAGRGDVGDDGVGTHGEAADGFRLNLVLLEEFEDRVSGEAAALGVERGGAAVDVVVAGAAGGELELS